MLLRKQQHLAALKAGPSGAGEVEEELMKLVNVDENGIEVDEAGVGPDAGAEVDMTQVDTAAFTEIPCL